MAVRCRRGGNNATAAGSNSTGISFSEQTMGISSGYGIIDVVTNVPGVLFPYGTIVELYGLKSSSKTTLVLETMAYNFLINPSFRVLYVDYEKMLRKEGGHLS